jgi:hypothetical protein
VFEDVAGDGDGLGVVAKGEEDLPGSHGVGLEEGAGMLDVLEGGVHLIMAGGVCSGVE